ncbi:MAG: YncE family protein, partial [Candidatus Acidiferrales bacterium]
TVTVGSDPVAIAVNPVTNRVYSANANSNGVSVLNGATDAVTATVGTGTDPVALAVNPATNTIYVANQGSASLTVINGATSTVAATVAVGSTPVSVAANPITNTVYVASQGSGGNVAVINGATNTVTATLATGTTPSAVEVDPVNNKIYVTNSGSANVTVIDGATNTIETPAAAGTNPTALAVNLATDNVYVANNGSNNATVLTPNAINAIPLTTAVQGVDDSQTASDAAIFATANSNPSFTATASSSSLPVAPPAQSLYYQLDTVQGAWQVATASSAAGASPASFCFKLSGVSPGVHILYAVSDYGNGAAPQSNLGVGTPSELGNVTAYVFAELEPESRRCHPHKWGWFHR